MSVSKPAVSVNGRNYAWPDRPLVVVCVDGSEPAYMEQAMAHGAMPELAQMLERGANLRADCVIPGFTNPNNLSIVTGVPPSVHGISGNYFLDPETGHEVMMDDPRFLRAGTILAAFEQAGARVAVITAKEKLRRLLGHGIHPGLHGAVCFSAEQADCASTEENGIDDVLQRVGLPLPEVYSSAFSEFVMAAGVCLMEHIHPDITYLSTTDYVQHKHAPGTPEADTFYRMLDGYLHRLDELGATLAVTADHGMNAKHDAAGKPDVVYLQTLMDEWLGEGQARVILPITDPYVVHHGALGSFATVYLPRASDRSTLLRRLAALPGIAAVLDREDACARFELPPDRVGDLVVVSSDHKVIGTRAEQHDLSGLEMPLRSHGGLSEQRVPMLLNRPLREAPADKALRNFDAFDLALNWLAVVDTSR
jgi:phosphonoacetate hydrolase